jgi:hypothetical protein
MPVTREVKMSRRHFVPLVLVLLAAGCAGTHQDVDTLPSIELAGTFTQAEGASWLEPCGAPPDDPKVWITFTGGAVEQAERATSDGRLAPNRPVFLRVKGVRSSSVGPNGNGFLVREIVELRPAGAQDCAGR